MSSPARARFVSTDNRHSTRSGFAVLFLAILIILFSLVQTVYRLGLPTDGWSFARDTTGTGQRLIFDRYLSGLPTSLKTGDVLIAIEDKPYEVILAAALTLKTLRPQDWAVGQTVLYTVQRQGHQLLLDVKLHRLPAPSILRNLGRNFLMNPGPLLMLMIAAFVLYRLPRSPAAQLLFLFAACVFSSDGLSQVVTGTNVAGPAEMFYVGAYWPSLMINSLIWPLLVAPLFIHLFLSFPIMKAPLRRYPRLTLGIVYGLVPTLTLLAGILSYGDPLGFWRNWSRLSFFVFVSVLLVAITTMLHTLMTVREASGRAQIRWVAAGTLITSMGALTGSFLITMGMVRADLLIGWIATRLLTLGFPLAVAIAILRYHLFDIDIIINRTLVYTVLTGMLGAIYFGLVILLQFIIRVLTGEKSPIAVLVSTLTIAALFIPIRRRVQDVIDRRMYHRKYNPDNVILSFSTAVRNEVNLEQLSDRLVQVVEETMQPESVGLWLRPVTRNRHPSKEA